MDLAFSGLLWWGVIVSGVALVMLTLIIPAIGCLIKESNAKTEFFSARACYCSHNYSYVLERETRARDPGG
jgi:hypothetical protein